MKVCVEFSLLLELEGEEKLNLDRINAAVSRVDTVGASVVAFVTELAQELKNSSGDQAAVDAIAVRLDADADQIAKAITDNTPAQGGTPPPPPPANLAVAGMSPASGVPGDMVTISGSGIQSGVTVDFGGAAANVVSANETSISAQVPTGTGTVDVTVTNPDGQTAKLTGGFTYTPPVPPVQ